MPNGHAATKDEMTANTNHGSVATDKDGGAKWWRGKQQMRQTYKKIKNKKCGTAIKIKLSNGPD
jgi:hypothetical protein